MHLSPKVLVPALGQIVVGIVLLILGLANEDATLQTAGVTAITTGLGTLGIGSQVPPATDVTQEEVEALSQTPRSERPKPRRRR